MSFEHVAAVHMCHFWYGLSSAELETIDETSVLMTQWAKWRTVRWSCDPNMIARGAEKQAKLQSMALQKGQWVVEACFEGGRTTLQSDPRIDHQTMALTKGTPADEFCL